MTRDYYYVLVDINEMAQFEVRFETNNEAWAARLTYLSSFPIATPTPDLFVERRLRSC